MSKKIAVLLLNLGGPDSISAIRPFLTNLFLDRQIIRLPLQPIMARLIARGRAKKVAKRYEVIGGKSPILDLTNEQADLVKKALNDTSEISDAGVDFETFIGMRYWHPLIGDAVKEIKEGGFDELVALSLFPHYSRATTGSCVHEFETALGKSDLKVEVIDRWFDHPVYLDAISETIKEGLNEFSTELRKDVQVLFSAHALPQEFVDDGDPYPEHLRTTIDGVVERTGELNWHLTYQSRSGPVEWMEPQTDGEIRRLASEGHESILVVPISFVSDHIETLFEIDIMYKELAVEHGIKEFKRSPSLNSRPTFIKALSEMVWEKAVNKSE